MSLLDLRSDPRFLTVTSPQERAAIIEQVAKTDERFLNLPEAEQINVLNAMNNQPINYEAIKNQPKDSVIDPNIVGLGSVIGGVAGGLGGKLFSKGAGMLVPAIEGALTGGGTTLAGEVVRASDNNSNISQLMALGTELALGAAPSVARDIITRIPTAGLMAVGGYAKAKTAQAVMGTSESNRLARERIFGRDNLKQGTATDTFRTENHQLASKNISQNLGIPITEGQNPQDVLRTGIYEQLTLANDAGNTLKKSPEYVNLMTNLKQGLKDGVVKKEDITKINSLINSQNSPYSPTKIDFNTRLINTIQQAEPMFNGEPVSKAASNMMKESFDSYLTNLTGKPLYSELKKIEMQDKIALARDSLPVLLNQGFKGEQVEQALRNLSKSPEGQNDFKIALASYMKALPEKEALTEFNRLYPIIVKSRAMPLDEALKFKRQVATFVNKGFIKKAGDISGQALKMGIITGVAPAEVASRLLQQPNDGLQPFMTP